MKAELANKSLLPAAQGHGSNGSKLFHLLSIITHFKNPCVRLSLTCTHLLTQSTQSTRVETAVYCLLLSLSLSRHFVAGPLRRWHSHLLVTTAVCGQKKREKSD